MGNKNIMTTLSSSRKPISLKKTLSDEKIESLPFRGARRSESVEELEKQLGLGESDLGKLLSINGLNDLENNVRPDQMLESLFNSDAPPLLDSPDQDDMFKWWSTPVENPEKDLNFTKTIDSHVPEKEETPQIIEYSQLLLTSEECLDSEAAQESEYPRIVGEPEHPEVPRSVYFHLRVLSPNTDELMCQLLYEDDSPVPNQILDGQMAKQSDTWFVKCRISELTRNHRNNRFKVRIYTKGKTEQTYKYTVSSPVKVLSKSSIVSAHKKGETTSKRKHSAISSSKRDVISNDYVQSLCKEIAGLKQQISDQSAAITALSKKPRVVVVPVEAGQDVASVVARISAELN